MRKTFVFALDHIFFCELGNSPSSVALTFTRFIRTQAYQGEGAIMTCRVPQEGNGTKKFENHCSLLVCRSHVFVKISVKN